LQHFVIACALQVHAALQITALKQGLHHLGAEIPNGRLRADELLDFLRGAAQLAGETEAGQHGFFGRAFVCQRGG